MSGFAPCDKCDKLKWQHIPRSVCDGTKIEDRGHGVREAAFEAIASCVKHHQHDHDFEPKQLSDEEVSTLNAMDRVYYDLD